MKRILLTILVTIVIINLGRSQTLNVPDNIGSSTNEGKVGIGITNPLSTLTIGGNPSSNAKLGVLGTTSMTAAEIQQNGTANILNLRNATDAVVVFKNSGYVGIGTTNPKSKLHILNENSGILPHSYAQLVVENNDHSMFSILTPNNKMGFIGFGDSDDNWVSGMIYDHSKDELILKSGNENYFWIKQNGYVGVGTDDPKAKLSVNGTIISTEIKVLADISQYPDFVFSDNYKLKSLKEVEKYIEINNHLPDIPKADEVKEGIALGEMNIKLLQKIEELTLYTIEQQKQIEALKEIIERNGLK